MPTIGRRSNAANMVGNDRSALMQIPDNMDDMSADEIADAFLCSEATYVEEGLRALVEHFEKRLQAHNEENRSVRTPLHSCAG